MIALSAVRRALLAMLLCALFFISLSNNLHAAEPTASVPLPATGPIPNSRGEVRRTEMSVMVPIPTPRPPAKTEPQKRPPARKQGRLPAKETACRRALTKLGVSYSEQPSISEAQGCSIAYPLEIKHLSEKIALKPEATLNCETALTLARFFTDTIPPLARGHLKQPVTAVRHASAYVCRTRAGLQKLSEHAFGNALDIASFDLADGSNFKVARQPNPKSGRAKFLDAFRSAACGPFKTVLGPGTNADHASHFHLDLQKRRNDSLYCK
ncbi:extensin family protein [Nitratireductor kimnyeongensis]|uniref:Extensin family protein n=1 Tax=Nitratireductor kimnyeongensis TaxID=430679 RepID=A0ABW0T7Y3_9HYPH|nr:extensin family protein [Nitratireductor kimnyeongensis]QZZ36047.1 extensin family protein [Nitratireductor kimnyeongensis]